MADDFVEHVEDRCHAISECLESAFGWSVPHSITVAFVPHLEDLFPSVPRHAEALSHRSYDTIIIEASAYSDRPEVLAHELAHLALPPAYDPIAEPLKEGLCNLAAMSCASSREEADRIRLTSLRAVFEATGGIAFDVSWRTASGTFEDTELALRPGPGAYLLPGGPPVRDLDRRVPRTRVQVATFVLSILARQQGLDATLQRVAELASPSATEYPELELARGYGIDSVDALRLAAAREADTDDLVQIVLQEAGWLSSRLDYLGVHLRASATAEPTASLRISLQGSDVQVEPSDLQRGTSLSVAPAGFGR
jgi:hypothetical protein